MATRLNRRLLLGPLVIALLSLIGVLSGVRPALEASLQADQRADLERRLALLVRVASEAPGSGSGSPSPAANLIAFERAVPRPARLRHLPPRDPFLAALTSSGHGSTPLSALTVTRDGNTGTVHAADGELEHYALASVEGDGRTWMFRLSEPDRSAAEVNRLTLILLWVMLIGGVAGTAITAVDGRRIAASLVGLRSMVRQIRHHDFRVRMAGEGEHELRVLELEMNKLARSLNSELADLDGARRRLWGVLDGMSEGVLVTDQHGVIMLANRALGQILRFHGPAVGRTVLEVYRSPELSVALENAMSAGEPVSLELQVRVPEVRQIIVRLSRLGDEREPEGVVAVLHDVTDMRRLEQVRRDFVANASHELRTPLAAIRGYAEALLDGEPLPEEARGFVEVIERNATRLGALVDDILALARIESPTYKLEMRPVDLEEAARTVATGLASLASERGVALTVSLPAKFPRAWADRDAVEHVLTNLVENALKYTPPGGTVRVVGRAHRAHLFLEVVDTGVGIPPDDLSRIFERFYRVDSARSRAVGGTGLGLAIVKHLTLAMGGEVSVRSLFGAGSTFTVMLRRVPEEIAAETEAR